MMFHVSMTDYEYNSCIDVKKSSSHFRIISKNIEPTVYKVGLFTFMQFNDLDITLREMKIMNLNKKEINQLIETYVYTSPITNTISISKDKFFILINIMFWCCRDFFNVRK